MIRLLGERKRKGGDGEEMCRMGGVCVCGGGGGGEEEQKPGSDVYTLTSGDCGEDELNKLKEVKENDECKRAKQWEEYNMPAAQVVDA